MPSLARLAGGPSAPVQTPHLRLRAPRASDLDRLCEIWTDPEVSRLLITQPRDRREVAARRDVMLEHARHFGMWVVELRATGVLIGRCGFHPYTGEGRLGDRPEPELAFLLARAHWGRGLATEAARAALDSLFRRVRLPRAIALVRPEHAASRRVLGKLGMSEQRRVALGGVEAALYAIAMPHEAGP
jgi:ribosomal-protein-alanine N-acetyltransferase